MISILIPVFEYDVRPLVYALHAQCKSLGILFEIICIDDASSQLFQNKLLELGNLEGLKIELLNQNIGRASIRNKLVEYANFPHLLFLDSDVMPNDEKFIYRYLSYINEAEIICGGRSYSPEPPMDMDLFLHWYYGSEREVSKARIRQKAGWDGFQTNNFLISKQVFQKVRFEESIKTYGHEDTLFGLECQQAGYKICHIDNPAIHLGLEPREKFILKLHTAIINLISLKQKGLPIETKLSRKSDEISNSFFFPFIYFILHSIRFIYFANNRLKKPFLTLLDVFKLYLYLTHIKANQKSIN